MMSGPITPPRRLPASERAAEYRIPGMMRRVWAAELAQRIRLLCFSCSTTTMGRLEIVSHSGCCFTSSCRGNCGTSTQASRSMHHLQLCPLRCASFVLEDVQFADELTGFSPAFRSYPEI